MAKRKASAADAIAAAIAAKTEQVAPPEIKADDPEGRQAGNPNDTIELPPGFLEVPKPTFEVVVSDTNLTDEELTRLTPPAPERRPDVVLDNLPQPAVISERTRAELEAGRTKLAQVAIEFPHLLVAPPPPPPMKLIPEIRASGGPVPAQEPVITEATLAEQAAGRAAVARKEAEYARGREIAKADAARRAREGAPADGDDLSYTPGKS